MFIFLSCFLWLTQLYGSQEYAVKNRKPRPKGFENLSIQVQEFNPNQYYEASCSCCMSNPEVQFPFFHPDERADDPLIPRWLVLGVGIGLVAFIMTTDITELKTNNQPRNRS